MGARPSARFELPRVLAQALSRAPGSKNRISRAEMLQTPVCKVGSAAFSGTEARFCSRGFSKGNDYDIEPFPCFTLLDKVRDNVDKQDHVN